MSGPDDIASRPTRMLEAGLLFGIAIDAIRAIKVHPRKGGQRSALVSIVFSVIALESFVNEMTEHAQNMSPTQPAEVGVFAQMMGDADDDHASLDFRVRLAYWIMTGRMMDKGSQTYQDALLIWLRNDLVHTRPNKLFAYGKTTNEEVHGRLLKRFRAKNILAEEYSASWTHLVQTRAVAEWSARAVASVVNEICSGTSQSEFQKRLSHLSIRRFSRMSQGFSNGYNAPCPLSMSFSMSFIRQARMKVFPASATRAGEQLNFSNLVGHPPSIVHYFPEFEHANPTAIVRSVRPVSGSFSRSDQ